MSIILEVEWLESLIKGIGGLLMDIIRFLMPFFYWLATSCFQLLDMCQLMFRYMSGLENYTLGGGDVVNGDLFFRIFQKTFFTDGLKGGFFGTDGEYSVLAIAFWSLVIIGALLLLVTTVSAIIRNEYNPDKEKKNSKSGIIKNFFKALASFAIVPIASFFGLWLGNAVLFAIDSATTSQIASNLTSADVKDKFVADKDTGTYCYLTAGGIINIIDSHDVIPMKYPSISGMVNKVCLYSANRIRCESGFYEENIENGGTHGIGIFDKVSGEEKAAQLIDDAFSLNAKIDHTASVNGIAFNYMNRNNRALVQEYYDLEQYNLILAVLYIVSGWGALIKLTFGLVSRLITLFGLLFLEPLALSFMPIDNGTAFGEWRKYYIARILSLFMVILAVNVFYLVSPIFLTIDFFDSSLIWANGIVHVIFIMAMLSSILKIDELFNKIISGEKIGSASSVSKSGEDLYADAQKTTGKITAGTFGALKVGGAVAATGIRVGLGAVGMGVRAVGAIGSAGAAGIRGLGQIGHRADNRMRESRINSLNNKIEGKRGTANMSDGDVFRNSARSQYSENQNRNMQDAYSRYAEKAGDKALSFDDWQEKTGSGSYMDAMAERRNGTSLREYYDRTHDNGSDEDFEKWKQEGKAFSSEFKEQGLVAGQDSAYAADKAFLRENGTADEYVAGKVNNMDNVLAGNDRDSSGINSKYASGLAERDKAREDIADMERKIRDHETKINSNNLKSQRDRELRMSNWNRAGTQTRRFFTSAGNTLSNLGQGAKNVLKQVGDTVTSIQAFDKRK